MTSDPCRDAPSDLLLMADDGEACIVARLDAGQLLSYHRDPLAVAEDTPPQLGDIYLARIRRKTPQNGAYFVDLGGGMTGFLEAASLPHYGQFVGREIAAIEGACLLVTVTNPAVEGKQPRLSAKIQFYAPSMILSLSPHPTPSEPISLSRQIAPAARREQLRQLVQSILAPHQQILLRSAAMLVTDADLGGDYATLCRGAEKILELAKLRQAEQKLGRLQAGRRHIFQAIELFLAEATASTPSHQIFDIMIQDGELLTELKSTYRTRSQALTARGKLSFSLAPPGKNILTQYRIDEEYQAALESVHDLAQGGKIIIDARPMACLVDIDRGNSTASPLALNLAAIPKIRRLIGVRNLAGLILIDFLRMKSASERGQVDAALRAHSPWGKNWDCHGFTPTGLYEVTLGR